MKIAKTPPKRHTVGVQMQEELYEYLKKKAKEYRCESLSKFLRNILLKWSENSGFDISGIENPKWGVRRDIASGDEEATRKFLAAGEKGRAVQAANRKARRTANVDGIAKEKGL